MGERQTSDTLQNEIYAEVVCLYCGTLSIYLTITIVNYNSLQDVDATNWSSAIWRTAQ